MFTRPAKYVRPGCCPKLSNVGCALLKTHDTRPYPSCNPCWIARRSQGSLWLLPDETIPGLWPLEVDHIIPQAAGGSDEVANLWLACRSCNQYKGKQVYGRDPQSGRKIRLFDPRRQLWKRHFRWSQDGETNEGLTACGRATVIALNLNNPYAVETRRYWVSAGWHPPAD